MTKLLPATNCKYMETIECQMSLCNDKLPLVKNSFSWLEGPFGIIYFFIVEFAGLVISETLTNIDWNLLPSVNQTWHCRTIMFKEKDELVMSGIVNLKVHQ